MKQPDRFERMIERVFMKSARGTLCIWSNRQSAKRLLTTQYRALRRVVKRQPLKLNPTIAVENWGKGYNEACIDILAMFDRWRKS